MKIRFKKLNPKAGIPQYAHEGDSGMDVRACLDGPPTFVYPFETVMIPTGLSVEIPVGYEIQVRPRSGLAAKNGVTVLNTPGTVDSTYRGEIKVILINLNRDKTFMVQDGDKIAQLVVAPVMRAEVEEAAELSETERGSGGFGSTGV